jgi:hypothetical protein
MTYNNENGPIYSMLNGKPCSTDFLVTGLRDPVCPCRCYWIVGYMGDNPYVNDATSCPPEGSLIQNDYPESNYYTCSVLVNCNCDNPSFSATGSIFTQLEPMFGGCNGTYGMQCGVCIDGQCDYASIY